MEIVLTGKGNGDVTLGSTAQIQILYIGCMVYVRIAPQGAIALAATILFMVQVIQQMRFHAIPASTARHQQPHAQTARPASIAG